MQMRQPGIILFTERYADCVAFYRDLLMLPTIFEKQTLTCLAFGNAYLMLESHGVGKTGEKTRKERGQVRCFKT